MNLLVATVWTPGEMAAEQAKLLASAQATDTAAKACSAIPAATQTEWATWLAAVTTFCNQTPVLLLATSSSEALTTGTRADQLQNYEAELKAWQQRFSGYTACNFPPSLVSGASGPSFGDFSSLLKWGVVAAGIVATAVVVSKAAEVVELFGPKRAA
jgi:hypothetical protein